LKILLTADPELNVPPVNYGGIERIIAGLLTELRKRGHTVGLVAHAESTAEANAFFAWPGKQSQKHRDTLTNCLALRKAVKAFRPDVLHSFSRLLYLLPLLPTRLPKIMSYQRNPSLRTTKWARRLARGTLYFTGCSEYICGIGRRGGGNWTAIHNFVELKQFTFQPTVAADAPLVFLSRIERIKGAHVAIEVAKKTRKRLILAGNHSADADATQYWKDEIEPNIGKNGIEYVGPVNDEQKNQLLGQAAAMLVPIQWDEPFGIVFAESLACGTPVMSCPRGALPEIVRQGVDGFLTSDIHEQVNNSLRLNQLQRHACRARAEACFSSAMVAQQYEQLYLHCGSIR
jgi:glycosyltransferase involved in cell wall biosynthesis